MSHYVCTGGCKGVSETPGVCGAETCPLHGHSLKECFCEDNLHEQVFNGSSDSKTDASPKEGEHKFSFRRVILAVVVVVLLFSIYAYLSISSKVEDYKQSESYQDGQQLLEEFNELVAEDTTKNELDSTDNKIARNEVTTNTTKTDEEQYFVKQSSGELYKTSPASLSKQGKFFLDTSSKKVYYFEQYVPESENDLILAEISNADLNTFVVHDDTIVNSRYASDVNKVYFLYQEPFVKTFNELRIIEGADPDSFEAALVKNFDVSQGNTYQGWLTKDKNHVYYQDEIFEYADPETFKISENVSINFDKDHVYLWQKILPEADPLTYEVLRDDSTVGQGTVYGKDRNNFFVDYCMVSGVDSKSVIINATRNQNDYPFTDKFGDFKVTYNQEQDSCSVLRD